MTNYPLGLSYGFSRLSAKIEPVPATPNLAGTGGGWVVFGLVTWDRIQVRSTVVFASDLNGYAGARALYDKQRIAKTMKDSIGVDISKLHFDAFRLATGDQAKFDNTPAGMRSFRSWLGHTVPELVVFEATGPYHRGFETAFAGHLPLVKVNPLQARRFAEANGSRAKTDAVDARMLARMGSALDLAPGRPSDKVQSELKELQVVRSSLNKDRTRLINRLKTLELAITRRLSKARLAQVERQIAELDNEIDARLLRCPERARRCEILTSIPGVGAVTARVLLVECPEIGTLNAKQVAALAGLAPMTRQSGQWRGKAVIQGGRKQLREALYMPALAAARFNPDLSRKYADMVAAGKPPKLALTAIMRKLIELANALVKADRSWQPIRP